MPSKVRDAYERGDHEALRRMREKAVRTRSENNKRRKEQAATAKLRSQQVEEHAAAIEQADAEEWYRICVRREAYQIARARQDHLLPKDEQTLPF